jgi:hypothetical protein
VEQKMIKTDKSSFSPLQQALIRHRNIDCFNVGSNGDAVSILQMDIQLKSKVTVLMTDGFRHYKMPVSEKHIGKERVELYFCLPDYWDLKDSSNPNMNWVFDWLDRLAKYAREKESWYGHGHTLYCGSNHSKLSATMKQDHFLFIDPMLLREELAAINYEGEVTHFLAVIPLFKNEFEYKQRKGTFKFMEKMLSCGMTEKLDDFRTSIVRSKWKLW